LETFFTIKFYSTPLPDKPIFFNLSSKSLKDYDYIFKRGLKHVPKPLDTSDKEIDESMESFKHKIGWNYFMKHQEKPDVEFNSSFKTTSKPFHFSGIYGKPLDVLEQTINDLNKYKTISLTKHCISKETLAIRNLKNDTSLFWTPSDKNLGLVCLNTLDYHQLVMKHLQQPIYSKIGPLIDNTFFDTHYQSTKRQFVKLMNEVMIPMETNSNNTQIIKYLKEQLANGTKEKFKYPAFHALPKLHKGLKDLKSRPVVGAVDWYTTPVSKILSFHLNNIIKDQQAEHLLSRTTDTITRLNQIKRSEITSNSILVTLDIESLYTNIDLSILNEILEHFDPYLKELSMFINNNNKFEYLGDIFKQSNGIAMGTNAAPEMANLYLLTLLDTQLLQIDQIKAYCRFLDDLFFVWNGSESSLDRLISKLQVLIPGIKFTCKKSRKMVEFLDLCIVLDQNEIHYYTHQKLMNKYAYITPSSCHPLHVFKGWIKAELNRYKNNSSRRLYYQRTKELFYQRLLDRGYPRSFLTPIFKTHYYVFPNVTPKEKQKVLPLIIRYSKRPKLISLVKLFHQNAELTNMFPQHKLLVCWKKSRNIQDILCSSRLSKSQEILVKTSVSGSQ
jgi:hypothetical protein